MGIGKPPHQRTLTEAGRRVGHERAKSLAQFRQTGSRARKASMVAINDPEVPREKRGGGTEGAHVFGDNDPAFRDRGFEHPLVACAAQLGPMCRWRNGIDAVGAQVLGKPPRVVLLHRSNPRPDRIRSLDSTVLSTRAWLDDCARLRICAATNRCLVHWDLAVRRAQ